MYHTRRPERIDLCRIHFDAKGSCRGRLANAQVLPRTLRPTTPCSHADQWNPPGHGPLTSHVTLPAATRRGRSYDGGSRTVTFLNERLGENGELNPIYASARLYRAGLAVRRSFTGAMVSRLQRTRPAVKFSIICDL